MTNGSRLFSTAMARRILLLALAVIYFVGGCVSEKFAKAAAVLLVAPFAAFILIWELREKKVRWNPYNILLFAASGFLTLASLRNRNFMPAALSRLIYCLCAMLLAGILPVDADDGELRRETRLLFWVIVIPTLALLLPAILSVFLGRPLYIPGFDFPMGIDQPGNYTYRIRAFSNTNVTARLAVLGIVCAVYCLYGERKRWHRVVLILGMIECVLVIAHCQSRAASVSLGFGAGVGAFRWVWLRLSGSRWRCPLGAVALVLAAVLTLALLSGVFAVDIAIARGLGSARGGTDQVEAVSSRIVGADAVDVVGDSRVRIWKSSLDYLRKRPADLLLGMGTGSIMDRINPQYHDYMEGNKNHLHNSLMETLARGGVFMLICILAILCMLAPPAFRVLVAPNERDRGAWVLSALIAVLLVQAMVESLLFVNRELCNVLFFYAAARVRRIDAQRKA